MLLQATNVRPVINPPSTVLPSPFPLSWSLSLFLCFDHQLRSINLNALGDSHISFTPLHLSFSPDEKSLLVSTGKFQLRTCVDTMHILQSCGHCCAAVCSCRHKPSHSIVLGEWRPDCQLLWCCE